MNKTTHEVMNYLDTLIKLNDNFNTLLEWFPESESDIDLLMPYVEYEIKKTLKDIIHIERL